MCGKKKSFREWMEDYDFLPSILGRERSTQGKVFQVIGNKEFGSYGAVDWVLGNIYVIDCFLYFMAKHGYTLQRSRKGYEFFDLDERIFALEKAHMEEIRLIIEEGRKEVKSE